MGNFRDEYREAKKKAEKSSTVQVVSWAIAVAVVGGLFLSCVNTKVNYQNEREEMHQKNMESVERAQHRIRGEELCKKNNLQC